MKIPKSSALNWALILAVSGGMVLGGCKQEDFGPDIDKLQSQIDANKSAIDQLKTLVGNGKYVKNVTTTATGIKIEFSDGQSVEVKNGTNGTNGTDGTNGTTPTFSVSDDGYWVINGTKTAYKAKGADGENGEDGEDGQNGQDGVSPEITIGQDGYWYINGGKTNMRATPGTMAVVEQPMFYEVTFTDATSGATTDVVRLPRVTLFVSGLSFVPSHDFWGEGTPVMVFPRIVKDANTIATTLYQGAADLSFKVNPASVDPTAFTIDGLISKKVDHVDFWRAGEGFSMSAHTVANGELSFTAKPTGYKFEPNNWTSDKTDYLALQVKNLHEQENDENGNTVVSNYVMAKEQIVILDEITLRSVKNGNRPYSPKDGAWTSGFGAEELWDRDATPPSTNQNGNQPAYWQNSVEHFTIGLNQTYNLADSIRAFYVRQGPGTLISFDDNGFNDYVLKFRALPFEYLGVDQTNDYLSVTTDGTIKVKPSPQGGSHTAALGRTPIVEVKLYAANGTTLLASNTIKIKIADEPTVITPINVSGLINLTIGGTDYTDVGFNNLHLDEAYNKTGLSKAEFDARYTFVADPNNSAAFQLSDAQTTTNRIRVATIAKTVKAGTYVVKGKFVANGHPDVIFTGTITLNKPNYSFVKIPAYWNNNAMEINGRNDGGSWNMVGVLPNAWKLTQPTAPTNNTAAAVTVEYVLDYPGNALAGVSIAPTGLLGNYEISLANNANGRKYVDGSAIKVRARIMVNGTVTEDKTYTVQFQNPVRPLVEDDPHHHLIDKSTTGGNIIQLEHTVKLTDYDGNILFDFTYNPATQMYTAINDAARMTLYGVQQPFTYEFVKAESGGIEIDLNPATNPNQHIKIIDAATGEFEWVNNGENLQGDIDLTFKVTAHNKWNQGEVLATKGNVEKEYIKIKLKKNPNL